MGKIVQETMILPPKGSIVGIWYDYHYDLKIYWMDTFHYILGEPTGKTKVSYWLTPLSPWYEGKRPPVRANIKQHELQGAVIVTEKEYKRRWEEKKLQAEQEIMWKALSKPQKISPMSWQR